MDTTKDPLVLWAEAKFQFDDDDLASNRQGLMSRKQRARLMGGGSCLFITALVCGIFTLAVLVITSMERRIPSDVAWVVVMGVIVSGIYATFSWMGWRSLKAGKSAQVKSVTGYARLYLDKKKLYLCVSSELQVEVEPMVEEFFSPNKKYRFYYCDLGKTILSVEI